MVENPQTEAKVPSNLEEYKAYLDKKLTDVRESMAILAMSSRDMTLIVENSKSLKRLKKLTKNILDKNMQINKEFAITAMESLTLAIKTADIVASKNPALVKEDENKDVN